MGNQFRHKCGKLQQRETWQDMGEQHTDYENKTGNTNETKTQLTTLTVPDSSTLVELS